MAEKSNGSALLGGAKIQQPLEAAGKTKLSQAEIWAAVYRALRQVDLYDLRKRTIDELSGGQKQRVLIARALADGPSLLLLDEPFTGLDHPNQDALAALFQKLRDSSVAILMSTHDLTQAVDICDRLVMLNRTVRAIGAPHQLLDRQLWMETYQVQENSALLRMLGMGVGQ
ncbi:ATP-binding cassette domain-containing protein [Arcanobacterium hippocoleae]|uniref:ATP-binding cassette domain-containing protein n=1 Tax=Arcanobacterium hippocoleae TaxID=149017 RepID=UPI00333F817D